MLAIIIGIIFLGLGIWGLNNWWANFIYVVKGSLPFMIIGGGILAIIAGITSIKDSMESKDKSNKNQ